MSGMCNKLKCGRKLWDGAKTWTGCRFRMGGWVSHSWHRKEIAILRSVGVFKGSHMSTEKCSTAEGGVQVIKELREMCRMEWRGQGWVRLKGIWREIWKVGGKEGEGTQATFKCAVLVSDEELGGPRVDRVGCKTCRCSRSPLVRKMCGFGPLCYLFVEDNKTLILSITVY